MISKRPVLFFFFILLGVLLFLWRTFLPEKSYLVTKVTDGDTILLENNQEVRYLGLDAPEPDECYGEQAQNINEKLVAGKEVRLEFDLNKMDRFGRQLAYVFVQDKEAGEIFVNEYLLKKGAATFFLDTVNQRYQSRFVLEAEKAHQAKEGLWRFCAPDPLIGCIIKGNYDIRGHRWYHLPEFRHYDQTVVNLQNGDQWFCTEADAVHAGFQRARE